MSEGIQQTTYFGTPINVTSLAKMRLLRLRVGKQHAERVHSWYMQMRDLAKQGSTFGQFTTNAVLFVDSIGGVIPEADELDEWIADRAATWDAFEAVRLIDLDGDVRRSDELFRVTVLDFADTNVTRPTRDTGYKRVVSLSNSERSAVKREQARRVTDGLPKMSDVERDEWLLLRCNDTPRHGDTTRHAIQTDKEYIQTSSSIGERDTPTADVSPPDDDDDIPVEVEQPLPPNHPSNIVVQLKQARSRLGQHALSVERLIATCESDGDRVLSDRDKLSRFYRPACELLAEVGSDRMRSALGKTIQAGGSSVQYAATVARSDQRQGDARAKSAAVKDAPFTMGQRRSEAELRAAGLLPPIESEVAS